MWRQTQPPLRSLCFFKINDIHRMESMTATLNNTEEKLWKMWQPRVYFTGTETYLQGTVSTDV